MQIKNIAGVSLLGASLLFVGCGGGSQKPADAVSTNAVPAQSQIGQNVKFAYVELDSLEKSYQYFIDTKAALEAKSKKYDSELNRLGANLQNAAAKFQEKAKNGQFASQAEAANEQKSLMERQAQLEQKQAQYAQELGNEQLKFNAALQDSLTSFLSEYNQTHKYTMIFSKVGGNILLADKALDITADVIAGLNKRYKKK